MKALEHNKSLIHDVATLLVWKSSYSYTANAELAARIFMVLVTKITNSLANKRDFRQFLTNTAKNSLKSPLTNNITIKKLAMTFMIQSWFFLYWFLPK